jgi:acetolactate decarboxylase
MAADVIDHRLIGALHVRALSRAGLEHDPATEHVVWQTGTLDALLAGRYDGDVTIGELLAHGNLGIGTLQHLAGEMLIVDGVCWVIDGDGLVHTVADEARTPFAVLCAFSARATKHLTGPLTLAELDAALDELAPPDEPVVAVRVDGAFRDLRLRSVRAQTPPYPPLVEVTQHQTEWELRDASGTLVGFRFPDASAGIEVPGYHLHFISDDRAHGGHVLAATLVEGDASVDGSGELHVELPDGMGLGEPGVADRAAIRAAEGGSPPDG